VAPTDDIAIEADGLRKSFGDVKALCGVRASTTTPTS
jgi:ABC-type sugar transport system ATPase subunit